MTWEFSNLFFSCCTKVKCIISRGRYTFVKLLFCSVMWDGRSRTVFFFVGKNASMFLPHVLSQRVANKRRRDAAHQYTDGQKYVLLGSYYESWISENSRTGTCIYYVEILNYCIIHFRHELWPIEKVSLFYSYQYLSYPSVLNFNQVRVLLIANLFFDLIRFFSIHQSKLVEPCPNIVCKYEDFYARYRRNLYLNYKNIFYTGLITILYLEF
jgi:hypothetical protein